MNYASTARRANPAAAMGALGVPAAFGALLIFGLAVAPALPTPDTGLTGVFVPTDPIVEPPAPPDPVNDPVVQKKVNTPASKPVAPPPMPTGPIEISLGNSGPITLADPGNGLGLDALGPIDIAPMPSGLEPVAAAPRGDPGGWISDRDYRTSWVNRGYEGQAGFALTIDARGRISDCTITRSTGYDALDQATCRLLQRRARFEPARDSSGNAIAGRYTSTVNWTIPQ